MMDPDKHQARTRKEALASALFFVLCLCLGLIVLAAQARADVPGPVAHTGGANPCCIER
ncbi:hypothetical protein [Salibaculum sp.]|uniref:hypothetical protein n=1 Tax=Salibaculum sp. TaxID=2855480 RepID=UPI002B49626F|nr:hypothetical protein [Salibaculum sp.]HKL69142.1 hypothetical protein [Salibaculum sp.]